MTFDSEDFRNNRLLASLGYVIFFLPLLLCPSSRLGRHAANQGLLGLIVYLLVTAAFWLVSLLLGWIPIIGGLIKALGVICRLGVVAVMIYYGVQCWRGHPGELPFIGSVDLLH